MQLSYPLHSGEPKILQEKQNQEIAPGIDLDSNTHLLMIEGIALAQLILKFKKLLRITDAEFVIPTRHFKNKRVIELQYKFIELQSKVKVGSVGQMGMTSRKEGLQSVREVLALLHPGANKHLKISISRPRARCY